MKKFLLGMFFICGCIYNQSPTNNVDRNNYIRPLEGTIPLVVILSNHPNSKYKFHNIEEYRKLYSNFNGNKNKNAEEYFYNVSHGKFTFSFQDFWGPYDFSKNPLNTIEELEESIINLYNSGFDFKFFDKDKNNILTSKELLVTIINNSHPYFGLMRHVNLKLPNDLKINMFVSMVGTDTNLATIIHEISHSIGTIDLYGSGCLNEKLTIMSCTLNDENNGLNDFVTHLDPWHKIKLGWIKPRIVFSEDLQKKECFNLEIPQYNNNFSAKNQRPLLLYDNDLQNYFLIEYRNRNIAYNNIRSYDDNFPNYGIIVWVVSENKNQYPYNVYSMFIDNENTDKTIWVYNPENNRRAFIWQQNQIIKPVYSNGTKSSFIITTGEFKQYSPTVKICINK